MEEKTSSKKSQTSAFLASMPPAFAFWAGVIATMAVVSVIGFIVMLIIVLGDGSSAKTKTGSTTNTNVSAAAAGTADPTPSGTISSDDIRNVQGEGELTIVEFSDVDCPFCKRFHPTMNQVMNEYKGKVAWAYHHFPLSIHPGAQLGAEATECASDQGKFWEYTNALLEGDETNRDQAAHAALAESLGLDKGKFESCLSSGEKTELVNSDAQLAQSLGAQGTPYSVIVDEDGKIVGSIPGALPFAQVKTTLDSLLN